MDPKRPEAPRPIAGIHPDKLDPKTQEYWMYMSQFPMDIFQEQQLMFCAYDPSVLCPDFSQTGCCVSGDKCTKFHLRPPISRTILFPHLFINLEAISDETLSDSEGNRYRYTAKFLKRRLEEFYEEIWMELVTLGDIEDVMIARNSCDHLVGNVYVRFATLKQAKKAMEALKDRTFEGRLILPEYCITLDFNEAICKPHEEGTCAHMQKHDCSLVHVAAVSEKLQRKLLKFTARYKAACHERQREKERIAILNGEEPPAPEPIIDDGRPRKTAVSAHPCYICGEFGHISRKCPERKKLQYYNNIA